MAVTGCKETSDPGSFPSTFIDHLSQLPPGKRCHLLEIYHGVAITEPGIKAFGCPVLYPFYSQPLVELAISIPTYEHFNSYHDRILFRKSVGKTFKTDMVWKKTKGETSGVLQLGVQQNLRRVQELCIEGHFARQGFVSPEKIELHIECVKNGLIDEQWPFINLLATELWLEAWL